MAYDDNFYWDYEAYLVEPTVRRAHGKVFKLLENNNNFKRVIDLGCGFSNEFFRWGDPKSYLGLDINIEKPEYKPSGFMGVKRGDYRDKEFLRTAIQWERSFISLFSSEITANYWTNYELYNHIFATFPKIQAGLVSGFYYTDKTTHNPVEEVGGVLSFQTLEPIETPERKGYEETRITMAVPSKMFGDKVIEVWKIFTRI